MVEQSRRLEPDVHNVWSMRVDTAYRWAKVGPFERSMGGIAEEGAGGRVEFLPPEMQSPPGGTAPTALGEGGMFHR